MIQEQGSIMQEYLEEYRTLLKRFVDLQQKLTEAFELAIEIVPPSNLPDPFRKVESIIKPECSISEILDAWPSNVPLFPFLVWVRPRVGVLQLEDNNWMFNIHGAMEIQFVGLPPELEKTKLESLQKGEMDVLRTVPGCGPVVESTYYEVGRVYGLTAWSALVFVQSVDSRMSALSLSDHENLVEKLVQEEFLISYPEHTLGGPHFILAEDGKTAVQ
jgi:hypothetical protein